MEMRKENEQQHQQQQWQQDDCGLTRKQENKIHIDLRTKRITANYGER